MVSPAVGAYLMLIADVRLYNRDELIERLPGCSNRSSDSELLLAAWLRAGENCLSWIAGDFALAVFDARSQTLTLARDPTGQMPLHFARKGEEFAFASMPTGLAPFVGGAVIDRLALAASVSDARDEDRRSHFQQIERVLPAEIVQLAGPAVQRKIYWFPATFYEDSPRGTDLVSEYRQLLDTAIADRLKDTSLPIATHLSSGYDSSAVTATAARLVPSANQVVAFTSAPAASAPIPPSMWRIGDESEVAAATANALGVRHIIVRSMPKMRNVIRRQSLLFQEPFVTVPNIAWLLQIRLQAAELGAECLLSGDSGNFTLNAGGLYILSEWVRRGRFATWARQARLAASRPDTRWRGVMINSFQPWVPTFVSEALRRHYLGAGPSDHISFLRPEWRMKAQNAVVPAPRHRNGYDERAYWIRTGNPGMLRKGGLAGEGIDERDPLADQRLIEFSLKIPPEQLYWNGEQRPLARAALADRLPPQVIDLKVRGLQSADWALRFTRADARTMLEEISGSETARDLFDLARMKQAIERWPTDNWNEQTAHRVYRQSLIAALSAAMFALVHEQGASVESETL